MSVSMIIVTNENALAVTFPSKQGREGCREDQEPKLQDPPRHPGTEVLALPDDRRRPVVVGVVGPVRVELELTVVVPPVEVGHVRPG